MKNSDDIAVAVKKLGKSFRLPHEQHSGIKQLFVSFFRKNKKRGYETQHVLNDISFEIKKGDFFGIVGRNGSGKSTLLKVLAGIYTPDHGKVEINGSLIPFIELGVGFNPELTGRENVYLNGALLGFGREEMNAMYDDIVAFAELERFMDQRLKNYSSGMQVRLAFSIAIKADVDILVLDEVLAVGDEAFQRKCFQYFAKLKKDKKTVILVTHSMDSVQQFCTKALMIEKGEILTIGNPAKVAQKYREIFAPRFAKEDVKNEKSNDDKSIKPQPIDISAKVKRENKNIKFNVELMPKENIDGSIVSLFIDRDTGEQVYRFSSDEKTGKVFNFKRGHKIKIDLELQDIFPNGIFSLRISVKNQDRTREFASVGDLAIFEIDRRLENRSQWDIHWRPDEKFSIETDDEKKSR